MSERTEILTPVGRLVQGDPYIPQTKDADGNPLVIKNGPNTGQPRVDYFMAIAVPKTDPGLAALVETIKAAARRAFPQQVDSPTFAFKMIDGDSQQPNTKDIRPCDRIGFPGNMVFYFSSGFAPKCYIRDGNGSVVESVNKGAIRRGYYVRIYGSVTGNGSQQRPGVYLNHSVIERVAFGEEIKSGPDGATVFGAAPALPAGASATPVAGAPLAPSVAVQPAPDFLAPAAPAAPAAPPEIQRVVPGGKAFSESVLLGIGWSQEQLNALPIG